MGEKVGKGIGGSAFSPCRSQQKGPFSTELYCSCIITEMWEVGRVAGSIPQVRDKPLYDNSFDACCNIPEVWRSDPSASAPRDNPCSLMEEFGEKC